MKINLIIALSIFILMFVVGIGLYVSTKRPKLTRRPPKVSVSTQTSTAQSTVGFSKQVTYQSNSLSRTGYLCKPEGAGPFAGVIYNHGGKEGQIGGAPEETCQALAKTGLVGFSPIRREELSIDGNQQDVLAATQYIRDLDYIDKNRLAMIGFSRGGLLTMLAANQVSDFKALIVMAPAPPRDGDLDRLVANINQPVFILVAENDTPSKLNGHENLVQLAKQIDQALQTAGRSSKLIIYPPYQPTGHLMFFQIGDYWADVEQFLKQHLFNS